MRFNFLLLATSIFISGSLQAGLVEGFHVVDVRVDRSGKGFVSFDQHLKSPATCINHHPNSLSFDVKTDAGKGILSLMLSAQAQKARVWAWGTNTCEEWPNTVESWNHGWIHRN
ncbi:hypothetical protein [Enterovibrio norvegicus]|uniref:hypothetical protein n=1 Tax=Enterovibrio norvegicus TaxID=188144 RepID=UPI000C86025C|nr:hypothetical protein [Enterovibrio norvegicus]PMH72657.1 hypothetical protein BCU62_03290 [Enterovibrio norvegicus]